MITLVRYLSARDPGLIDYLEGSVRHAEASGLPNADLAVLRLLIGAVGRR